MRLNSKYLTVEDMLVFLKYLSPHSPKSKDFWLYRYIKDLASVPLLKIFFKLIIINAKVAWYDFDSANLPIPTINFSINR